MAKKDFNLYEGIDTRTTIGFSQNQLDLIDQAKEKKNIKSRSKFILYCIKKTIEQEGLLEEDE